MPVNLSVKNVPDEIAEKLRRRAERHHRSLQGELMSILEKSVNEERYLSPSELLEKVRAFDLRTPDEAAGFVRKDRDEDLRR
ncbi:MAG: Arc family DNA-binding protein [bacterium]|nr:MAG: Arc family DNA-binding protein [bacterium]